MGGSARGAAVGRLPLNKGGVDVLEEDERLRRHRREGVREAVVRQARVGEVEDADVVADLARDGGDKGRLAAARLAVHEVAASIRDAAVGVPLRAVEELLHVCVDVLGDALVQHHRMQRTAAARRAEGAPLGAPVGVDDRRRLLLGLREGVCLVKEVLEQLAVAPECRELDALPWHCHTTGVAGSERSN